MGVTPMARWSVPSVGLGDEVPVVERGAALPARTGHVLGGGVAQAEGVTNLVAGGVGEEVGVPGSGVEDDRGTVARHAALGVGGDARDGAIEGRLTVHEDAVAARGALPRREEEVQVG